MRIRITQDSCQNLCLKWGLTVYTSNKLQSDTDAAGLQTASWVARFHRTQAQWRQRRLCTAPPSGKQKTLKNICWMNRSNRSSVKWRESPKIFCRHAETVWEAFEHFHRKGISIWKTCLYSDGVCLPSQRTSFLALRMPCSSKRMTCNHSGQQKEMQIHSGQFQTAKLNDYNFHSETLARHVF